MNRFRSVLLIPPIGLTSAASPRPRALGKDSVQNKRSEERAKTDRKSSRTWSGTHASFAFRIGASEWNEEGHRSPPRASTNAPFVYVRASQHEQPAGAPAHPREELREEVCDHHAQACLNVLQREVLCVAPAVRAESRPHARHDLEERPERRHDGVHV